MSETHVPRIFRPRVFFGDSLFEIPRNRVPETFPQDVRYVRRRRSFLAVVMDESRFSAFRNRGMKDVFRPAVLRAFRHRFFDVRLRLRFSMGLACGILVGVSDRQFSVLLFPNSRTRPVFLIGPPSMGRASRVLNARESQFARVSCRRMTPARVPFL